MYGNFFFKFKFKVIFPENAFPKGTTNSLYLIYLLYVTYDESAIFYDIFQWVNAALVGHFIICVSISQLVSTFLLKWKNIGILISVHLLNNKLSKTVNMVQVKHGDFPLSVYARFFQDLKMIIRFIFFCYLCCSGYFFVKFYPNVLN